MKNKIRNSIIGLMFILSPIKSEALNIAVIAPQEGVYQKFGQEIISGVQTAVNHINASGGLRGEKINLITVDDQCDNNIAISTAQMLAVNISEADKVALVIGPYCSNSLKEVTDIYGRAKIFEIIPIAVNSKLFTDKPEGLVTLAGYTEQQSADFYQYYKQRFSGEKVALIYDSNDRDTIDMAAALQQEFQKNGKLDLLQAYSYASFEDIEAMAEEVLKDKQHIAYILGNSKQTAEIASELKEEKKDFIIFTNKYVAQEDYDKIMGRQADDMYYFGLPSLKDNPDFAGTLVHLRLAGVEPEGLGVYGYSAVKLWEELVKGADSFEYEELAAELKKGKIRTTWGEVEFKDGAPANSLNFSIYKRNNGQYTQVY